MLTHEQKITASFVITLLALLTGLIFSLLSQLGACTESCAQNSQYHLFGLPFASVGIVYFAILIISFLPSKKNLNALFISSILVTLGIGSEFMFILIQKMNRGWCPLCLGIAATIFVSALSIGYRFLLDINNAIHHKRLTEIIRSVKRSLVSVPMVLLGLLFAFLGITKVDHNEIETHKLEAQMAFGDEKSDVNIFVFTSWTCPACRKLEASLERMIPKLITLGRVTFVDFGEDMTTLNYLPYNLSFMIHNKSSYVPLRNLLKEFSTSTGSPSEEEVEKGVKELSQQYHQLNYSDIALAIEYYRDLANKYKVKVLPAVVIDKKGSPEPLLITGINITMENIRKGVKKE